LDIADIGIGLGFHDRGFGFSSAEGDQIDLSLIDADPTTGVNDAFSFALAFTGAAGEVVLLASSANTLVQLDLDGDGTADGETFVTVVETDVIS
jgi:hypothetical protein